MERSLAQAWESSLMHCYQSAAFREFENESVLGVSSDAARLGDPPEGTGYGTFWNPQTTRAAIGLPMVRVPHTLHL